jgi:hypothetical protein
MENRQLDRNEKVKQAQAEHGALARAYYELSLTPNGQLVINDLLEKHSAGTTVRTDDNGAVDALATLHAVGRQDVSTYIRNMVAQGSNRPLQEVSHG